MKHTACFGFTVALSIFAVTARAEDGDEYGGPNRLQLRVEAVGSERNLFDLTIFGGGLAVGIGTDGASSPQGYGRAVVGRTLGALTVQEYALGAGGEFVLADHLMAGYGAGITTFGVARAASSHGTMWSVGPEAFARLGVRFGRRDAAFVTLDVGGQLQDGGPDNLATVVWGPTLGVGYLF